MSEFSSPPCPRCEGAGAQPVKFTWWGGMLGPKLLSIVQCPSCGQKYNGKTGQASKKGIIIYCAVVSLVGAGVGVAVGLM